MRRRYRFNEETHSLEEVPNDYTGAERRAPKATEELTYGGLKATDGTPLDSKRKHREYMQRNGLALSSDYTETIAKDSVQRVRRAHGELDRAERRETIGRALHESRRRR